MAAQTDTYANLILLIEARLGASLATAELTRAKHLINSRAHMIYRETDFWPNMLVVGEERAVDISTTGQMVMPYTGAYVDADAALSAGNPYGATVDTFMRVHQKLPWHDVSANEYQLQGVAAGTRLVGYSPQYGLKFTPDTTNSFAGLVTIYDASKVDVYVGGKVKVEGYATATVDINGTHTVTSATMANGTTTLAYTITDTTSHTFSLTGDETVKVPSAYATYKKRLTGTTYTDGSAIPAEWFEPIAYGVMADILANDEKFEASLMWESRYRDALQLELEGCERAHATQTIGNKFHSHGTEQGRQSTYI